MNTTKAHLLFVFTLLIGAAIMDQKQYDDFNEQLGGQESKSALAFAEIFDVKDKKDDEDGKRVNNNEE